MEDVTKTVNLSAGHLGSRERELNALDRQVLSFSVKADKYPNSYLTVQTVYDERDEEKAVEMWAELYKRVARLADLTGHQIGCGMMSSGSLPWPYDLSKEVKTLCKPRSIFKASGFKVLNTIRDEMESLLKRSDHVTLALYICIVQDNKLGNLSKLLWRP